MDNKKLFRKSACCLNRAWKIGFEKIFDIKNFFKFIQSSKPCTNYIIISQKNRLSVKMLGKKAIRIQIFLFDIYLGEHHLPYPPVFSFVHVLHTTPPPPGLIYQYLYLIALYLYWKIFVLEKIWARAPQKNLLKNLYISLVRGLLNNIQSN